MRKFKSSQEAFEYYYTFISKKGVKKENTVFIQNVGFYIDEPCANLIATPWRKWSKKYAVKEFAWYLSENRSVEELAKTAPMWNNMHGGNFIVNSNYGYQWNRNGQLEKVIRLLKENNTTRKAVLSIYDGKEIDDYLHDTPCTLSLVFSINGDRLNMSVLMRSNDLWFGFCNDQYCFSELQKIVANELSLNTGWYFHFVNDFHIYCDFLNKN